MRFIAWLMIVLILAACDSDEIDPPSQFPPGYTIAEGDRVALALPPDWETLSVNAEDFAQTADHLRQTNPGMASRMDEMAEEIEDDTLRFWAVHEIEPMTINITAQGVPPFESLENHAAANRRGLESFGYEILSHEETTLNGQDAEITEARIEVMTENGGTMMWFLVQYTLISGNTAYSISFGAPNSLIGIWREEFERIAGTFHTVN